ncbi:isoprenylcysteine carboxyl methyltransferase family protein [Aquipuribacter nitratireducens]|uniref:Isoprenylcysteine carboxyl methyltransferase family protein n=1 Tax=Aquipuribacter nitratireducens TaxID=650104 RepID=A0ABW0GPA1_9MICO
MSEVWYLGLVGLVVVARFVELSVARRHLQWARERGGVERGAGHYPVMVALHTALLVAAPLEVLLLDRPFLPGLGAAALVALVAAHALRWWCIRSLGPQWNTRVVVVPGLPLVTRGPYRRLRHPNYVAVVLEGLALPLVHTAWCTAIGFTVLDLVLLRHRVRVEEAALAELAGPPGSRSGTA